MDTYGVPKYREVNAALFTAISFPFLFGVMFGDVGHGMCLVLLSLFMIVFERRLRGVKMGEMVGGIFRGRFLLLLMGIFGTYCGIIYNDCFSLGLDLFGST